MADDNAYKDAAPLPRAARPGHYSPPEDLVAPPSPLFRLTSASDVQGPGAFSLEHIAAMLPAKVQRPVGGGALVGPNGQGGQGGAPVMVEGPGIVVFLAGGGQLPYPLPQGTDPQDVIREWEAAKRAWLDR